MRRSTVPPVAAAAEQRARTRQGSGVNRVQRCRSTTPRPMDLWARGRIRLRSRATPNENPTGTAKTRARSPQLRRGRRRHSPAGTAGDAFPSGCATPLLDDGLNSAQGDRIGQQHSRPPRRAGHDPVLRSNNPLAGRNYLSVAPSIRSRSRSAWPLWREYSSIMWLRIQRIDTSRPVRCRPVGVERTSRDDLVGAVAFVAPGGKCLVDIGRVDMVEVAIADRQATSTDP